MRRGPCAHLEMKANKPISQDWYRNLEARYFVAVRRAAVNMLWVCTLGIPVEVELNFERSLDGGLNSRRFLVCRHVSSLGMG